MKFILTRELGRLAKWLRILGLDTTYFKLANPSTLLITALRENRIIVTRNTKIGHHLGVRIIVIRSDFLDKQLNQIVKELHLKPLKEEMFSRCIICNEALAGVSKAEIKTKVPEYVFKTQDSFLSCPKCARIYWQGTHWGNAKEVIDAICS